MLSIKDLKKITVFRKFVSFLKPYWFKELLLVLIILASIGCSLLIPYMTKLIIDEAFYYKDMHLFVVYLIIFAGAYFLSIILSFMMSYLFTWVSNHILLDLRVHLFNHLLRLPVDFFKKNHSGDIIHRLNSEINTIQTILSTSILRLISNVFLIVGVVVVLCMMDYKLFLLSMAVLPFFLVNSMYFQTKTWNITKLIRKKDSGILSILVERIENVITIKAFNKYEQEKNNLKQNIKQLIKLNLKNVKIIASASGITSLLMFLSLLIIYIYSGNKVIKGVMTVGTFVAFIQYLNQLFQPLRDMMSLYIDIIRASVSMERILEFLIIKPEINEESYRLKNEVKITRKISFKDLSFSYNSKKVIDNITYDFEVGKSYAVVGASGSGKSTILNLICGFYKPVKGHIFYDEMNLDHIDLYQLRNRIVLITNNSQIFSDTIKYNMLYGSDYTEEKEIRLEQAAKMFLIDEFVEATEDNYDAYLFEKGANLSAGQKQRIALSRILNKDVDVIIFDEATTEIDSDNEQKIFNNIRDLFADKIFIIVSHRMSSIRNVNEIIFLQDGEIKEKGNFDTLNKEQNRFYSLFKEQLR